MRETDGGRERKGGKKRGRWLDGVGCLARVCHRKCFGECSYGRRGRSSVNYFISVSPLTSISLLFIYKQGAMRMAMLIHRYS